MKDKATEFTLQYFAAIEQGLQIEWASDGAPVFIPDRINSFGIQILRRSLGEVCGSQLFQSATTDMASYQKTHGLIQTSGVGAASDFDTFTKLGFLLGDRLVLWDTVFRGVFIRPDHMIDKADLGLRACELLSLKCIVERGGLIFMPHPLTWLDRARYYFSLAAPFGNISSTFAGFLNARSLLDEGIALHPYSMESDRVNSAKIRQAVYGADDHLNPDKEVFQDHLHNLLTDHRFHYLKNVSPLSFYEIMGRVDRRKQLQDTLSMPLIGLSQEEKSKRVETILSEIAAKAEAQKKQVTKEHLSETGLAAGAVGAVICLICDAAQYAGVFTLLGNIFAAYAGLQAFRELFTKEQDTPTLYQVFYDLSEKERQEQEIEATEQWRNIGNLPK